MQRDIGQWCLWFSLLSLLLCAYYGHRNAAPYRNYDRMEIECTRTCFEEYFLAKCIGVMGTTVCFADAGAALVSLSLSSSEAKTLKLNWNERSNLFKLENQGDLCHILCHLTFEFRWQCTTKRMSIGKCKATVSAQEITFHYKSIKA